MLNNRKCDVQCGCFRSPDQINTKLRRVEQPALACVHKKVFSPGKYIGADHPRCQSLGNDKNSFSATLSLCAEMYTLQITTAVSMSIHGRTILVFTINCELTDVDSFNEALVLPSMGPRPACQSCGRSGHPTSAAREAVTLWRMLALISLPCPP